VLLQDPLNRVTGLADSAADVAFALSTEGSLALLGTLAAPEVLLTLGGSLTQAGGLIETPALRANAFTGDVLLTGPGNRIAALLPSGAARDFALVAEGALDLAGALDAGRAVTLAADTLTLAAPIVAPAVTLRASGDILQPAGRIATALLTADGAAIRLDAPGNAIAAITGSGTAFRVATATDVTLGDIAAAELSVRAADIAQSGTVTTDRLSLASTGTIRLDAANAIASLGAVTAPGGLTLRTTTALHLTEPLSLPAARLVTGGALSQAPFATLGAGRLTLDTAGGARLDQAGNAIAILGASDVAGDLALTTSGPLTLEGAIRSLGVITLTAFGDIAQTSGFLQAPVLQARAIGGSVTLEGANLLGAAGGFAAASWRLADAGLGTMQLAGLLAAPEVSLRLAGSFAEGTGGLRAAALALDVAGAVTLETNAAHLVGALSGRAGALRLAAGGPLEVTGPLAIGGALALQGDSLAILSPVAAGSAFLVAPGGDIAQAAGAALTLTGPLQVFAAGAVALEAAGNRIPILAAGTAGAGFALATTGALTAGGALAGETITLRASGPLTLDQAQFQAGSAVLISAPGGLAAGMRSTLDPLDPARLPLLILDVRAGALAAIPAGLAPDIPGLPAAAQPTQIAAFGPPSAAPSAGAAFDLQVGAAPVFLLLDGGPAVGTLEAGRFGLAGSGGTAFLVGAIGGVGGQEAAALVSLSGSGAFQFNGCPAGIAHCGRPPEPAPPPDPPAPPGPPEPPPPTNPPAPPGPPEPPIGRPDAPAATLAETFAPERLGDAAPWSPWPVRWPLPPLVQLLEEEPAP
jgi:hypothetical protein